MAQVHTGQNIPRWKLFLSLSRTPHCVLDLAAPGLAAVLWLGGLPPLRVLLLGMLTAFAGYTAVYALNDLVDLKVDRQRLLREECPGKDGDLDVLVVRHPLAQGLLSAKEGGLWTLFWVVIALVGAYYLRPACAGIFLMASSLEVIYCLLLRITPLRVLISGLVKISGPAAAVLAVDPHPSIPSLGLFLIWLFLWEIGGQNVPNDWVDRQEDEQLQAKTVPVCLGARKSTSVILAANSLTTILGLWVLWISPGARHALETVGGTAAGGFLLLVPAWRLHRLQDPGWAAVLFNRASYYPLVLLILVLIARIIQ